MKERFHCFYFFLFFGRINEKIDTQKSHWIILKLMKSIVLRFFLSKVFRMSAMRRENWETRLTWKWGNHQTAQSLIKDHGERSNYRHCNERAWFVERRKWGRESLNEREDIFIFLSQNVHNIPRARIIVDCSCVLRLLPSISFTPRNPPPEKTNVYFRKNKWIMHLMWTLSTFSCKLRPIANQKKKFVNVDIIEIIISFILHLEWAWFCAAFKNEHAGTLLSLRCEWRELACIVTSLRKKREINF